MIIRLGYVSIALSIFNNTPSSTFTYKLFSQRPREEALQHAIEVGRGNLEATKRILYFNAAHGIRVFRLSSSLIPLATHPDVMLDVGSLYKKELRELGDFARREGIRLTMHPNQFTLLNGSDKVVSAAIEDLQYHAAILDGMGMDESGVINIHVGGVYGDKASAIQKLYDHYPSVPDLIKRRLTFENDDKTYTLEETAAVCEHLCRPLVLDLHHDWCTPSSVTAIDMLPRIRSTWGDIPMKIHVSSPKSEKEFRAHADFVDPQPVADFLRACKEADMDSLDVIVEAKMKDHAVLKLAEELGKIRGVKRIDGAVLKW
ncbi:UV DNA damage repair endonuclease UvsE [Paenibacillus gansuensis]|uniref:UV DNA damage repair endonuclease UvsE n=1 Tax=Paenibacillus gansuensis TaxID=306542 RepID=A0ABW5PFG1_9BACL